VNMGDIRNVLKFSDKVRRKDITPIWEHIIEIYLTQNVCQNVQAKAGIVVP
jgi:hypothetical protein